MPDYLHGSSPSEHRRLAALNAVLNERCLAELAPSPGDRILDLGAGTGLLGGMLAERVGSAGLVVGIERDPDQIRQATVNAAGLGEGAARFELRAGDALTPPLTEAEWGSFDIAHARFLLEHLADPQRGVERMLAAVRPGGRIVLIDDDHSLMRCFPPVEGFERLWDGMAERIDSLGGDSRIGRKLPALLHRAGARPVRTTLIPYTACHGSPPFATVLENLTGVLRGARTFFLDAGWAESAFDRALDEFHAWGASPEASVWYAIPCAVGERAPQP